MNKMVFLPLVWMLYTGAKMTTPVFTMFRRSSLYTAKQEALRDFKTNSFYR